MKKTIRDFDLTNKKVIIRCDLNVPIKGNVILDDNRIRESIKTINYAISKGAKVIILSHLGRIKSEEDKAKNSLYPVSVRLSELINKKVTFVNETRGDVLERAVEQMSPKDVILIQNTRYEDFPIKKESSNDEELGKYWAHLGDIFINDAFGCAHRAHASNVGVASHLPSGIGFLVEKELNVLEGLLNNPIKPYLVIIGGAKMNDKIKVISTLVKKADHILLGGGIANTFLKAKGFDLKKSIYDEDSIEYAKQMLNEYEDKIILPIDGYGSSRYEDNISVTYSNLNDVTSDVMILDIGPKTIELFSKYINEAKTVFWNGPVGVSEFKNFEYGTKALCDLLEKSDAKVVIGGGDSAASAIRFGYKDSFEHISTGGGASLEFIEGKSLPGIEIIEEK